MLCKKCGAQIGKANITEDGRAVCPSCGAVYRKKAKEAPVVVPDPIEITPVEPEEAGLSRRERRAMAEQNGDASGLSRKQRRMVARGEIAEPVAPEEIPEESEGLLPDMIDRDESSDADEDVADDEEEEENGRGWLRILLIALAVFIVIAVGTLLYLRGTFDRDPVEPELPVATENEMFSSEPESETSDLAALLDSMDAEDGESVLTGAEDFEGMDDTEAADEESDADGFDGMSLGEEEAGDSAEDGASDEEDTEGEETEDALASAPEVTETPAPTPLPDDGSISVRFRVVGDIMVHKEQLADAKQKDGTYDFTSEYQFVRDALRDADYTIGNLETTITDNGKYKGYPRFRTPVALLDTLKDCGFDMFTMANNHMLDGYYDGLVENVGFVEQYGFDHVGAYRSQQERDTPVIVEIKGIKFGFVAYTQDTNGAEKKCDPKATQFGVPYFNNSSMKEDIRRTREAGAEVVIAFPHWGNEYEPITGGSRWRAEKLIEAGADIIIGSHPHVVHKVEFMEGTYEGKKKKVLVAWSMSNFISAMTKSGCNQGLILEFTVKKHADGTFELVDPGYVPIYVLKNGNRIAAVCSGDYYYERPDWMPAKYWKKLRASAQDVIRIVGKKIKILQH